MKPVKGAFSPTTPYVFQKNHKLKDLFLQEYKKCRKRKSARLKTKELADYIVDNFVKF
jgi:hypothetical protein